MIGKLELIKWAMTLLSSSSWSALGAIGSSSSTARVLIERYQAEMKQPFVYILTDKKNGTLYTGVTSNPAQRISCHKQGLIQGFTKKYSCTKLVYFEEHSCMVSAIAREKYIKRLLRKKKLSLIESTNPDWNDLYDCINQE